MHLQDSAFLIDNRDSQVTRQNKERVKSSCAVTSVLLPFHSSISQQGIMI